MAGIYYTRGLGPHGGLTRLCSRCRSPVGQPHAPSCEARMKAERVEALARPRPMRVTSNWVDLTNREPVWRVTHVSTSGATGEATIEVEREPPPDDWRTKAREMGANSPPKAFIPDVPLVCHPCAPWRRETATWTTAGGTTMCDACMQAEVERPDEPETRTVGGVVWRRVPPGAVRVRCVTCFDQHMNAAPFSEWEDDGVNRMLCTPCLDAEAAKEDALPAGWETDGDVAWRERGEAWSVLAGAQWYGRALPPERGDRTRGGFRTAREACEWVDAEIAKCKP